MTIATTTTLTPTSHTCIIVGASHSGVTCAFELRKRGFEGRIVLVDADKHLPYHRPPLSKAYLNVPVEDPPPKLKSEEAYLKANIELLLGVKATHVNTDNKRVQVAPISASVDGLKQRSLAYTHLVIATGATPIMPPINGLNEYANSSNETSCNHVLVMRNANDAIALKALVNNPGKPISDFHIVVVGAGYIGLETAASLRKAGAQVTVIERESRPLARVASENLSQFVNALHTQQGVNIVCGDSVVAIRQTTNSHGCEVLCHSGKNIRADCLLVGVGVTVNTALAESAKLQIDKGAIRVDLSMQTSNQDIWAIGDCTIFAHPEYGRDTHIESVQNALEQAKVAAQCIIHAASPKADLAPDSGISALPDTKLASYTAIPWFWSDQFDTKLQIAGLLQHADNHVVRVESATSRSIWHFKGNSLRCVEAINCPKAYVLGSKWIATHAVINKARLVDATVSLTALTSAE